MDTKAQLDQKKRKTMKAKFRAGFRSERDCINRLEQLLGTRGKPYCPYCGGRNSKCIDPEDLLYECVKSDCRRLFSRQIVNSSCGAVKCKNAGAWKKRGHWGHYICKGCQSSFSILRGTLLAESNLSFRKWFEAVFFYAQDYGNVTSGELIEILSIQTRRTAMRILDLLSLLVLPTGASVRTDVLLFTEIRLDSIINTSSKDYYLCIGAIRGPKGSIPKVSFSSFLSTRKAAGLNDWLDKCFQGFEGVSVISDQIKGTKLGGIVAYYQRRIDDEVMREDPNILHRQSFFLLKNVDQPLRAFFSGEQTWINEWLFSKRLSIPSGSIQKHLLLLEKTHPYKGTPIQLFNEMIQRIVLPISYLDELNASPWY